MARGSRTAFRAGSVTALCAALLAGTSQAGEIPPALLPRPALHALESAPPVSGDGGLGGRMAAHPSLARAVLFSALLPGAGEYYSGHPDRAVLFGTLEASVWTAYTTFRVQENLRDRRAREYSVAFAGAAAHGDEAYYKAVGQFLRSDGPGMWNEFVRRKERDTGEVVGVQYTGADAWAWTSDQRFADYRGLRRSKLKAHDRARNAVAVAFVNRIASIVDVVQAMRSDRPKLEEKGFGLKLKLGTSPSEPLARVGLWNRF